MTSRSCLNWLTMSRLCTRDASSRRHHAMTSTCIHVTHTAMDCATHFRHCMGRTARCLVSLAHRLTCVLYRRVAPSTHAVPWLLTHPVQFYHHYALLRKRTLRRLLPVICMIPGSTQNPQPHLIWQESTMPWSKGAGSNEQFHHT